MAKSLLLRLPDEMHEALRLAAFRARQPMSEIAREAIAARVGNGGPAPAAGQAGSPVRVTAPAPAAAAELPARHPAASPPGPPPAARQGCAHPSGAVQDGVCTACGQDVV